MFDIAHSILIAKRLVLVGPIGNSSICYDRVCLYGQGRRIRYGRAANIIVGCNKYPVLIAIVGR